MRVGDRNTSSHGSQIMAALDRKQNVSMVDR
jgi:hypothetical protein